MRFVQPLEQLPLFNAWQLQSNTVGPALLLLCITGNDPICCRAAAAVQVEHWYHRHLPDPRLLLDGDNFLPCQIAARRNHADIARMLLPSNPMSSLFAEGELNLVGPPSLAAIAGAVLRGTLAGDLERVQQHEEPHQEHTTAAADAPAAETAAAETPDVSSVAAVQSADAAAAEVEECDVADTASCAADKVCGVCFDVTSQVRLVPCGHELCAACCRSLLALNSRCVMVCPFCRGGVAHLEPLHADGEQCAAGHAAAPMAAGPVPVVCATP